MAAEIKRFGSFVSFLAMTQWVMLPGSSRFIPSSTERVRHLGGKMLETYTKLYFSMLAFRKASSNDASRSRWTPTPLVKNIPVGTTMLTGFACSGLKIYYLRNRQVKPGDFLFWAIY